MKGPLLAQGLEEGQGSMGRPQTVTGERSWRADEGQRDAAQKLCSNLIYTEGGRVTSDLGARMKNDGK